MRETWDWLAGLVGADGRKKAQGKMRFCEVLRHGGRLVLWTKCSCVGSFRGTCDCCQTTVGRPWRMKAQRMGGYLYMGWTTKEFFKKEVRQKKGEGTIYHIIPFMENSRKWKLIYSDRKQTGGCLVMRGWRREREGLQRNRRKPLRVICSLS